ncbi:nuclear transport factor 2 family protein [Nakamurella sp. YIM 132087]|uniref:Nuclear transport factor 2 family protein n=1 Tax=Nakamurella alba TaxID=2665158 RepID=A0A7K1FID1_9ACTN|nr:nuclear transport factor 2 family protein [Nakamurella alba]MTD13872.1 nuclear transport factor 2 family protein [Nakamurella alba]
MTPRTAPDHLSELLRRYAFGYTAAHDFSVCDELMVDDYLLIMGPAQVSGREENYKPATARLYQQFPTLGFTVHDLVLGTDRAALRFSEHGRSLRTGTSGSWRGISMYRTRDGLLSECRVEQDYHSRREQLEGVLGPLPVPSPALDPWLQEPMPADPRIEQVVRDLLADPAFLQDEVLEVDDAHGPRVRLDDATVTVLDLFGAGERVAFHVRLDGSYRSGLAVPEDRAGRPADLYITGIVTVGGGDQVTGHLVTDRYTAARRLTAAP